MILININLLRLKNINLISFKKIIYFNNLYEPNQSITKSISNQRQNKIKLKLC